ncbi:MAG TPA: SIMPL domain-containing protein [Myxococcales bacterium]|nr:SIMPL domain-containing protein [Myxococcales bacterium]
MNRTLAAALTLATLSARAQAPVHEPAPWPRTIRASGDAHVSVRPDVAVVTAGVVVTGKDLKKATAEAAAQTREVLAALRKEGIAEKDLQTTRHDIEVERPWDNGRPGPITGYTVSDELRVTVRDVGKVGAVLERVVAAGSNALRGLSFQKDDPTPERARALALAVANARTKAEAMARAAGVQLGEVVAVSESGSPGPIVPMERYMAAAARQQAAPVSPGEVEVAASADVVFAIR